MSNMTKGIFAVVACLAFITGPALAAVNGDAVFQKTEKLWRIETSGIGG